MAPRKRRSTSRKPMVSTRSKSRGSSPALEPAKAPSGSKSSMKSVLPESGARKMVTKKRQQVAEELMPVLEQKKKVNKKKMTALDSSPDSDDDDTVSDEKRLEPNLAGDWGNITLLLVLYSLQGLPMGFASTVPLIMKERGVSFSLIGVFNLCHMPFSLKLLWAPLVDSLYSARIGRRKSWLIPTQTVIGLLLLLLSYFFEPWLGGSLENDSTVPSSSPDSEVKIYPLTFAFFVLYFLCATQDVAVDGWSLTMLRPENVGYQSMCNAAGQTFGYAVSFIGALSLQHFDLLSFPNFMFYCGLSFLAITCLVALLKKEKPVAKDEEVESLYDVYKQIWLMGKVTLIRRLVLVLLLWKIPYAGCEALTTLKLQEKGLPKEHVAYLGGVMTVISVFVPFFVGKYTSGPRPLDVCLYLYLPRLLMCGIAMLLVFSCPDVSPLGGGTAGHQIPFEFYVYLSLSSLVGCVVGTSMFCSNMGMFARVAPKDIAGTYLTALNMAANLGSMWVTPLAFWAVDQLTWKVQVKNPKYWETSSSSNLQGSSKENVDLSGGPGKAGSSSEPQFLEKIETDGFYMVSGICAVVGIVGFPLLRKALKEIQDQPKKAWNVVRE